MKANGVCMQSMSCMRGRSGSRVKEKREQTSVYQSGAEQTKAEDGASREWRVESEEPAGKVPLQVRVAPGPRQTSPDLVGEPWSPTVRWIRSTR